MFARTEQIAQAQQAGFTGLADALDQHGDRLEDMLADVQEMLAETHSSVLDVKSELEQQNAQLRQLSSDVLRALEQHRLEKRALTHGDSLSVRTDAERQLVKQLVARYRALPADERQRLPALLNAVGKLEVVAGDFDAAQRDFQELTTLLPDDKARAEAQHNAYLAALERRAWPEALAALCAAATLDPERFAPFPLSKFDPERILGAGGFGVAFLCRNRHSGSRVVVKTLRGDTPETAVLLAHRLVLTPVDEEFQAEIAKGLLPGLEHWTFSGKGITAKALSTWGTPECADKLAAVVNTPNEETGARANALEALGKLKVPDTVDTIARTLTDIWIGESAVKALKEFGPAAEPGLQPFLETGDDGTRTAICKILADTGTALSLPKLEKLIGGKNKSIAEEANKAFLAIKRRLR